MALRLGKKGTLITVSEENYALNKCGAHVADAKNPVRVEWEASARVGLVCKRFSFVIDESTAIF